MATIKIDTAYGFNQDDLDFSSLFYAADYNRGHKTFDAFYSNGYVDEFRGKGFTYDEDGIPTGGTVKSYAAFNGGRLATIDGLKVKVSSIVKVASSDSTKDDLKLIKSILKKSDTFKGGAGDDVFNAYGGNDKLDGKDGNDVLSGGKGKDAFVFSTTLDNFYNVDFVTDFKHRDDVFHLSDKTFRGLHDGHLAASAFKVVSDPYASNVDASDRILYEKSDGALYFDRDGSGDAYDPVQFAVVHPKTGIDHTDFLVM